MSQSKFEVNVSLNKLPPAVVKVVPYSGTSKSVDIYQQYRAMAFGVKIINVDTTNSITVSLDGEPTFTVPKESLVNLEGIEFTTIDLDGSGTGQIILKTIKQERLKVNDLIEVD